MDIIQLYKDYNIDYKTEGHKHCRPGWVNVECPFCTGNPGYHLGTPISGGVFHCYRCGNKYPSQAISKLLNVSEFEAKKLLIEYIGTSVVHKETPEAKVNLKSFKYPTNTEELKRKHRLYLEGRNFDPDKLIKEWGLLGTGIYANLDNADYRNRIIAPINWDNKIVSFQGRDITDHSSEKYKACSKAREIIHHQHILYGKQSAWKNRVGIGVEGITDVWRFGAHSFGVYGIEWTNYQVKEICRHFDRIPICFDGNEIQARQKADELIAELRFRGKDSFRVDIKGDPGMMDQSEANYLVKQLIK
jgi:hypothetical protein